MGEGELFGLEFCVGSGEGELNIADANPRRFSPCSFCLPRPSLSNRACVLECGGHDAALESEATMSILSTPSTSVPSLWLNSLFWILGPVNPNPKSTPRYRKSTVDLRSEPLIWGKNGLQTPLLPGFRRSFCPIKTRKWKRANQKPTETGQKINRPTVDLGCAVAGHHPRIRLSPRWTETLFYSNLGFVANSSKAAGNNPANALPFEEALKKLEGIVEAMESDDLPLEILLAKYEEGAKLVKVCREKLSDAELKIQQLEKNADKEMKLKAFETEDPDGEA